MSDGTFVKALAEQMRGPVTVNNMALVPQGWAQVTPVAPPGATPLVLRTLTGLRDYIVANNDGIDLATATLVVEGPQVVTLVGPLEGEDKQFRRLVYVKAMATRTEFKFGTYYDPEELVIALQTQFAPSNDRDKVLKVVSSISSSDVRGADDDGVAQEVTVRRGVTLVGRAGLPSPAGLAPWRTFREVAQPVSAFVLRARSRGESNTAEVALFDSDGGMWSLEAIASVAEWLRREVAAVRVIA